MGQKKVLVLFLIADGSQFLEELPKILEHADGVILTNIFGSEILTEGPFPNLLELATLAKEQYPEKEIGIEIYESYNIVESTSVLNRAKRCNFDHLWSKDGSTILDKISENSVIVYGADEKNKDLPALENIKRIKESLMNQDILVVCGGHTLENVKLFIPYTDVFVIHRAAIVSIDDPYTYDASRIKAFCDLVRDLLNSSISSTSQ